MVVGRAQCIRQVYHIRAEVFPATLFMSTAGGRREKGERGVGEMEGGRERWEVRVIVQPMQCFSQDTKAGWLSCWIETNKIKSDLGLNT